MHKLYRYLTICCDGLSKKDSKNDKVKSAVESSELDKTQDLTEKRMNTPQKPAGTGTEILKQALDYSAPTHLSAEVHRPAGPKRNSRKEKHRKTILLHAGDVTQQRQRTQRTSSVIDSPSIKDRAIPIQMQDIILSDRGPISVSLDSISLNPEESLSLTSSVYSESKKPLKGILKKIRLS
jgi:hypothetical protein